MKFGSGNTAWEEFYNLKGCSITHKWEIPMLYWSKPEIVPPSPPVRPMSVYRKGWVNLYYNNECGGMGRLYDTEVDARFAGLGHGYSYIGTAPIEVVLEVKDVEHTPD